MNATRKFVAPWIAEYLRRRMMLAKLTYKSAVKNILWEAETNFAATPKMLQMMRFMFDSSDYYKYVLQVQKNGNKG